jgi:hypothetical protein
MRSATDILAENNIVGIKIGTKRRYYAACPRCSHTRSLPHQKLKCLGVTVDQQGVSFGCNHCAWTGGGFYARGEFREPAAQDHKSDHHEQLQRQKARRMWNYSLPATGTIVETYLRSRAITVPIPATVRFLRPYKREQRPAMIVPFCIPSEPEPGVLAVHQLIIAGVHLTLLKPDGSGKADVEPNKLTIGPSRGVPLVLAPVNDSYGLAITEGIEDALSVHQMTGLGAWAAGAASRLLALADTVPNYVECVTLLIDDDDIGRCNGDQLGRLLVARGIEVHIAQCGVRHAA